ncbi:MAG: aminotransferase class V-fold PLP-dependent enzyme [Actinobacteria bacterium]|nr:aminotransferase class V-fold PLP-dependent enzyme [Actinomycetota bacterium]
MAKSTSLRSLWQLDPSIAHLNHGSFGAVPHDVQLVQESFQKRMNANPNRWFRSELPDLMSGARHITASWLGVDAGDFAFVPNAGQGVITAVQSLVNHVNAQHQTAHIVDTSLGYGGVTRGLQHIAARSGATYSDALLTYPVDLDAEVIASRLRECMPMLGAPTIVVLDHITSETGLLLPVSDIISDLRTTHPDTMFVIDGAHSAGMLQNPIPHGCDVWVGNLHKWLCAPRPAAALVCRNPLFALRFLRSRRRGGSRMASQPRSTGRARPITPPTCRCRLQSPFKNSGRGAFATTTTEVSSMVAPNSCAAPGKSSHTSIHLAKRHGCAR